MQAQLQQFIRENIPMTKFCDFSIAELNEEQSVVTIPFTENTKNHVGSMYFAALAMGADLASGLLAMYYIQQSGQKIVLVFKDFQAKFVRRAETDVAFTCRDKETLKNLVEKVVATQSRQDATVSVVAHAKDNPEEIFMESQLTISLK